MQENIFSISLSNGAIDIVRGLTGMVVAWGKTAKNSESGIAKLPA